MVTSEGDGLISPKISSMFKDASKVAKEVSDGGDAPDASEGGDASEEPHFIKNRSTSARVVTTSTPTQPQPKRAATEPLLPSEGAPEKVQLDGLPNTIDEVPREDGQKTTSSPVQLLPNLAELQFDPAASGIEVPMPESLKNFTQDHWDELVASLTNFEYYISALTEAVPTLT